MLSYDEIFTFEHLYISYKKCIRQIRWKSETQRFIDKDILRLKQLYFDLKSRSYKPNKLKEFDIVERGKPRHISAHTLRDRIVQRCLCDYCLTPELSKRLVYDCGATLKGKGITFTQKRTDTHLHQYYRHHGIKGYCLTIDVHHYFESIDHSLLKKKLSQYIVDKEVLDFTMKLIDLCGDKGLGLGSQISQICALFYLNNVDHFVKERLHIRYYARYMDDLYLIHYNKDYLKYCWKELDKLFVDNKLELNSKTRIHELKNGFIFTKIRYILTVTGHIIHLLTTRTFKSMHRKIKKGVDVSDVMPSWKAYLDKFDCYKRYIQFIQRHSVLNTL